MSTASAIAAGTTIHISVVTTIATTANLRLWSRGGLPAEPITAQRF